MFQLYFVRTTVSDIFSNFNTLKKLIDSYYNNDWLKQRGTDSTTGKYMQLTNIFMKYNICEYFRICVKTSMCSIMHLNKYNHNFLRQRFVLNWIFSLDIFWMKNIKFAKDLLKWLTTIFMLPFEEERAYCFAHVGLFVGRSVCLSVCNLFVFYQ